MRTSRNRRPTPRLRPDRAQAARRSGFAVVLTVIVAAGVVTVAAARAGDPARSSPSPEATGATNEMGMPVVETPGSGSGRAAAAGVTVDGAKWALGRVPLNVAVRPGWTLRNTGTSPVTIGEPVPEVRHGCCPGPFTIGTRTLAPGESTRLTFELSMHPGMDGWHDIGVHVPVDDGTRAQHLVLGVTGDFRN